MDRRHIQIARFLAHLLDDSIRIPGTSFRIGLDPLIGLIPGLGDAIAGLGGAIILLFAGRGSENRAGTDGLERRPQ